MAIIRPTDWAATTTYAEGDQVYYNGIVYEALDAITGNANNAIPVDNDNWELISVIRIEDYYSLQESIRLALNVDNDEINDSIPLFIQKAEQDIGKILRSPAQIVTREFTVDDMSRIEIPEDILDIITVRTGGTAAAGYDIRSQGAIQFLSANKTEFEELRQYYTTNGGSFEIVNYQYPVYFNDNRYFHLAPSINQGTTIEVTYFQGVPSLGETVNLVNDDYEPINANGQTLAQWVAAGNQANTFVQGTQVVLNNLWTATTPHLLRVGALIAAESYLKDDTRIQIWKAEYQENMERTVDEFERFKNDRPHSIQMYSAYARGGF